MQAQAGVLDPPKKHTLIQVYNFDDLPLITMNVARIGAQTPGMASEIAGAEKHFAMVGFGPMTWIWLTPDKPVPGGFRGFDETEIDGKNVPETDGDIMLYFSSDHAELNRAMASQVCELFGKDGELVKEFVAEKFIQTNFHEDLSKAILIDHSTNLDTEKSCFVLAQQFRGEEDILSSQYQNSFFSKTDSGAEIYTMTFSNNPDQLEESAESVSCAPVFRGVFFVPSLNLLTSLRMGGIRMGSLAINAKWKGH